MILHSDTERLDFVLDRSAFIVWTWRDSSIRQCQLWVQDEDEAHHVLSGDERFFNDTRSAIEAAMSRTSKGER